MFHLANTWMLCLPSWTCFALCLPVMRRRWSPLGRPRRVGDQRWSSSCGTCWLTVLCRLLCKTKTLRIFRLWPVLQSQKPCFRHTDVHHLRPVLTLNLSVQALAAHSPAALALLGLLGFGCVGLSTNAHGTKSLWFTKRPVDDLGHASLAAARAALRVPEDMAIHSLPLPQIAKLRSLRLHIRI